ncbi:MAG: hypothetical protein HY791_26070 [Deltaproteobacteria bacterium]|nr:hypothetical protein [Deltaproteobacteria bacterium]
MPETRSGLGAWLGIPTFSPGTKAVLLGAASLASLFSGQAMAATPRTAPTNQQVDRSIVFIGMNETASHEVEALRNAGAPVTFIKTAKEADTIKIGNTTYDLKTDEGRLGFANAIGLKGDRATALSEALGEIDANARDEAAQLAKALREAEKGTRNIERIVLSGHSIGSQIWGDGNGTLHVSTLGKLIAVFPQAAAQVQDLGIAACYSGGESTMETYRAMFPNLKTLWAYDGSAPGSWSGAVPHLTRWERSTRGNAESINRDIVKGVRKGENVAVWSASRGYDNGQPPASLESVTDRYNTSHEIVSGFMSGESVVEDSQTGPLRSHYNNIQRLLARRDISSEQRTELSKERDQVIRLLYWKNVGQLFQATHGSAMRSAFQDLGLTAPDFSKLSRKEVLEVISSFDAAKASSTTTTRNVTYAERLLHGLQDLSTTVIPNSWL